MLNMQNVACTASFMTVGMVEVDAEHRTVGADGKYNHDIYNVWGQGAVELHLELCRYAEVSEKIVDILTRVCELDFPGVYDYEVSEFFGGWFAEYLFEHAKTPSFDLACGDLIRRASIFFAQGSDDVSPESLAVVVYRELTHGGTAQLLDTLHAVGLNPIAVDETTDLNILFPNGLPR